MCHDCVEQRVVRTQKQTQGAKRVVLLWLSKDANTREKETNALLTNKVKLNIRNMKNLRLRAQSLSVCMCILSVQAELPVEELFNLMDTPHAPVTHQSQENQLISESSILKK